MNHEVDLSKGEDFATRVKVQNVVPWGMYKGIEVEVGRNGLEGWCKYELKKQKIHLGNGGVKKRLHSYGQIESQFWSWSCQVFQSTYPCLCLQQPTSSANPPKTCLLAASGTCWAASCLRVFALPVPSAWNALFPDIFLVISLTSFRLMLLSHLLHKVPLDLYI